MRGRDLGFVTLLGLSACAAGTAALSGASVPRSNQPARTGPPTAVAAAGSGLRAARYFQVAPEEAYWVAHEPDRDLVVVAGARLVLSHAGEVRAAAWENDPTDKADLLQGSLAIAAHLGGGYIHWSSYRAFRSADFTGPLEPIAIGVPSGPDMLIRGARNGLRGVLLFTDSGPREILPGAKSATAASEPALADLAAVSPSRALRLDIFGRTAVTTDGGASWIDASPAVGIAPRAIAAGPDDLWLDTWSGRILVGRDGKLGEPDQGYRAGIDYGKPFQLIFQGTRITERESLPWTWHDTSPIQAAIFGGAELSDGTAMAVANGGVARVDLATGQVRSMASDWLPQGVDCQPLSAEGGVLLLCGWESYQGYGGYVLRSAAGEPPTVEKAFSDDGYFVADDHGAVGYVGSCKASARLINPEDRGGDTGEIIPKPTLCVRRGPGDWAERTVDLDAGESLLGWIPRKDGTAVALITSVDPDALPEPAGRVTRLQERGGVRVLQLYQELGSWRWARPSWRPYMYGRGAPSMFVDKRFHARDDGSIDAWIDAGELMDMGSRVSAGVTIAPDGRTALHALPPSPALVVAAGDFGVSIADDGLLHETTDHGRTWRAAGRSPIPPSPAAGSCSRIGCSLSSIVRLGWGDSAASVAVTALKIETADDAAAARGGTPAPRLVCEPVGVPEPLPGGALPAAPSARGERSNTTSIPTGYGDTLEVVREGSEDPSAAAQGGSTTTFFPSPGLGATAAPALPPPPSPLPPTSAALPPGKRGGLSPSPASSPPLSTHTLYWRPPFEPEAAVRRLNATNATFGYRRPTAVPLLGERGEVALLVFAESTELLVTPSDVITVPAFDPRRYSFGEGGVSTGLWLGRDRALVLGDMRRRTSLEEHGPPPNRPPLYVALDREQIRRRTLAMGRRDDGTVGILALDGPAPETAGVAEVDRVATSAMPVSRLASWSTLLPANDPRCKAEKDDFRALVTLDPSRWMTLDERALPGVSLGSSGMALVRWGRGRVCVEALDVIVRDTRRRGDNGTSSLVVRWTAAGREVRPQAALRWNELRQGLRCSIAAAGAQGRR